MCQNCSGTFSLLKRSRARTSPQPIFSNRNGNLIADAERAFADTSDMHYMHFSAQLEQG
jgi:hypothetical protein